MYGKFKSLITVMMASLMVATFMSAAAKADPSPEAETKIEGIITRLDQYKIVVKVGDKDYIIGLDSKRTKVTGRPALDKHATVWYKTDAEGTLYAMKIVVPEVATPNANANADDPNQATLKGTLTAVAKDRITLRANGKEYKIMLDPHKTKVSGRMSVAKEATVKYKKDKGNLWAMSIVVPQKAANPNANASEPNTGKLEGTFTQVAKDRVTVRANDKEYRVMLDGKRTVLLGHPVVSKTGTVWYKKYKGNLWATKIQINKEK